MAEHTVIVLDKLVVCSEQPLARTGQCGQPLTRSVGRTITKLSPPLPTRHRRDSSDHRFAASAVARGDGWTQPTIVAPPRATPSTERVATLGRGAWVDRNATVPRSTSKPPRQVPCPDSAPPLWPPMKPL